MPTLGVWSDGDLYLDGERMRASRHLVKGTWRDQETSARTNSGPTRTETLNALLLSDWLNQPITKAHGQEPN